MFLPVTAIGLIIFLRAAKKSIFKVHKDDEG